MALQVDLSIGHHIFCSTFAASVRAALQLNNCKMLPFVDFNFLCLRVTLSLQQPYQLMDVGCSPRKAQGKLMNPTDFLMMMLKTAAFPLLYL